MDKGRKIRICILAILLVIFIHTIPSGGFSVQAATTMKKQYIWTQYNLLKLTVKFRMVNGHHLTGRLQELPDVE